MEFYSNRELMAEGANKLKLITMELAEGVGLFSAESSTIAIELVRGTAETFLMVGSDQDFYKIATDRINKHLSYCK